MFRSLLFPYQDVPSQKEALAATYLDLHLDQLFNTLQKKTPKPILDYLYRPLTDAKTLTYRQDVFRALHDEMLWTVLKDFETQFIQTKTLAQRLKNSDSKQLKWYELAMVLSKNQTTLDQLYESLQKNPTNSAGLNDLTDYLKTYRDSKTVQQLRHELKTLLKALSQVHYHVIAEGLTITVKPHIEKEPLLHQQLAKTFAPLLADTAHIKTNQTITTPKQARHNNLQAQILRSLDKLFPSEFQALAHFFDQYQTYQDKTIERLAQELNFYLAFHQFEIDLMCQHQAVQFVLPQITPAGPEQITAGFDLNLATKLTDQTLVTNDYQMKDDEGFLIISGPNQGGKTTYARMVGESYYLFSLGAAIPGTSATLQLKNPILTHFERQENETLLTGLLAADIDRIHQIIQQADPHSFVIINELFSSTTIQDAQKMGAKVLQLLQTKGAKGIYVTFIENLAKLPGTVSMMSQVAPKSTKRTYKIVRTAPNGKAYALSLLNRYDLSTDDIQRRF